MTRTLILLALVLVIVAGVATYYATRPSPPVVRHIFGAPMCGADQTANLQAIFNNPPASGVVALTQGACYTVDGSIQIESQTNLTIEGNGATFEQQTAVPISTTRPMIFLGLDTNVVISNLTLDGCLNVCMGGDGGENYEGAYALELEASKNVTLTHLTVNDMQGDCFNLQIPSDVDSTALNKNIVISGSTFDNCGYHGFTVEAVNGFQMIGNTMANVGTDLADFEVDGAHTEYSGTTPINAGQFNILIADNTFGNGIENEGWVGALYASNQYANVAEQNVTWANNTLESGCPCFVSMVLVASSLMNVDGTPPSATYTASATNGTSTITIASAADNAAFGMNVYGPGITSPTTVSSVNTSTNVVTITPSTTGLTAGDGYTFTTPAKFWTSNINFINNTTKMGSINSAYGGSPATPNAGSMAQVIDVVGTSLNGNKITAYDEPVMFGPYLALAKINGSTNVYVMNNRLPNAYDAYNTSSSGGNTNVVHCGNFYGVAPPTSTDGSC